MLTVPAEQRVNALLKSTDYGAAVCVRGWVRTRRDSKGGFSFIEVNDGSCMASLQVIAEAALPNYETEIKRLVASGAELGKLREQAMREGMKPLRIAGARKVAAGLTTIAEIIKVAPPRLVTTRAVCAVVPVATIPKL